MPRAELRVTIPESVWMGELSRPYLDTTFEILTVFPKAEGGVALAEITSEDFETLVAEMEGFDVVTTVDVLQRNDDTALVQF